jgi:hypothetical protein
MELKVQNYNINWIGWYGTNPEIELMTKKPGIQSNQNKFS